MISDPFKYGYKTFYLKTRGGCPFYKDHSCTVYDVRPFACRLFPFNYLGIEHAIYRWKCIYFDECSMITVPFTNIIEGNEELLIDRGIAEGGALHYLSTHNWQFNEHSAKEYLNLFEKMRNDNKIRLSTLVDLKKESGDVRKESVSNDTNAFTCLIYYSGFYNLYLKEIEKLKNEGNEVVSILPWIHGHKDHKYILLGFNNEEFGLIKKLLKGKDGISIKIKVLMSFNSEEWFTISIPTDGKLFMTFCVLGYEYKDKLKQNFLTDELKILFRNKGNDTFVISVKDILGWMSSNYPEKPIEYKFPMQES